MSRPTRRPRASLTNIIDVVAQQSDEIMNTLVDMATRLDDMSVAIATRTDIMTAEMAEVANRMDRIVIQTSDIATQMAIVAATSRNNIIVSYNSRYHSYTPLHKTVPGDGLVLAQAAARSLAPDIIEALVLPPQTSLIDAIPPNFNFNLSTYQHLDILNLIIFYNEDFGVVPYDSLETRIEKFRQFLNGGSSWRLQR